jgi:hypothetical protein
MPAIIEEGTVTLKDGVSLYTKTWKVCLCCSPR